MGNSGPFRGELGEATEGAIRTAAIIRWPGKVKPNTTTYAMFSIMDFLPTFASIIGGKMPTDRADRRRRSNRRVARRHVP